MKRIGFFVFAIIIVCSSLLISCTEEDNGNNSDDADNVVYANVCGDKICSANEFGKCDIDCQLSTAENNANSNDSNNADDNNGAADYQSTQGWILERQNRIREEQQIINITNNVVVDDNQINKESIQDYLPSIGFRVANRYNLLGLNENISSVMGTLTGMNMREVLMGGRISRNTEAFGPRVALYDQTLTLRSGKVVFGYEEESEKITTYLEFKEGEPIFDYVLDLRGGIFKFFEGEIIHFLGHDYIIEKATNSTLHLAGITTPDTIIFRNHHSAIINEKQMSANALSVNISSDYLRAIVLADHDIRMLTGTSLTSYLDNREALLTNRIDLEYQGMSEAPTTTTTFTKSSSKYRLKFVNNLNMSYDVPLAYLSPFKVGGEDYSLIYQEGKDSSDHNINKKDYFLINNNRELGGITNLIKLVNIDEEDKLITFQDMALEQFLVYYHGTPGVDANADLIVYNVRHKVYVGNNKSISVDLNGDGAINSGKASIITAGNGIIRINDAYNRGINISFITPKQMIENSKNNLETAISLREDGIIINPSTLKMENDDDKLVGLNEYGTLFILKNKVESGTQFGEDLIIINPIHQLFAEVVVKAYE